VARLLNKLLIEQTKSRPRHSNHNGLVESKNGAVIRKHLGYGPIAGEHAQALHRFYAQHLNPYLNYHRPCAQADVEVDEKGRLRRFYRRYQTPLETLLGLVECGAVSARRAQSCDPAAHRCPAQRHRGGTADATRQAPAL